MFELLNTPDEAYNYKLGAALHMERVVLNILRSNIEEALSDGVADLFRHHLEETEGHVRVLKEVFGAMGWEVDESPSPAIDGLEAEGKANAKKTSDAVLDSVLLQGAVGVEHHEIAVYENLIINARVMGRKDVVELLERNLGSEQHTLQEVKTLQQQVAAGTPSRSSGDGGGIMGKVKSALS